MTDELQPTVSEAPAPRPVRMFGCFLAMGAVLALPFLGYHVWADSSERARLREMSEKGKWTQGRVTAVSHNFWDLESTETVSFVYSVDGKEYSGSVRKWKFRGPSRASDSVEVLYHPDRPIEHRTQKVPKEELTVSWERLGWKVAFPILIILVAVVAAWLRTLFKEQKEASRPVMTDEQVVEAVRRLLREGMNLHQAAVFWERVTLLRRAARMGMPEGYQFYVPLLQIEGDAVDQQAGKITFVGRIVREVFAQEICGEFAPEDEVVQQIVKDHPWVIDRIAPLQRWLDAKIARLSGQKV